MKSQALIITAHRDVEALELLVELFKFRFFIFINVDKRSPLAKSPRLWELQDSKNVQVINKFSPRWGSRALLDVHLYFWELCNSMKEFRYIHFISGEDFPIISPDDIYNYFENTSKDYIYNFPLPSYSIWGGEGGLERIKYYHLYDVLDLKKNGRLNGIFIKLQILLNKMFGFSRQGLNQGYLYYGGSDWYSISRDSLPLLSLSYKDNISLYKNLRWSFCAAELYAHTVLMNSRRSSNVVNDNLRYIYFGGGKFASPLTLSEKDYGNLCSSKKLFARKFTGTSSLKLKSMLLKNWGLESILNKKNNMFGRTNSIKVDNRI